MQKILVFGASGFVGSHIVSEFVKASQDQTLLHNKEKIGIIGISRDVNKVLTRIEKLTNERARALRKISWDSCDTLDRNDLTRLFERHPDTSAVISCIGGFGSTEEKMRKANGPPNINLVHAVYENAHIRKMVYVSAAEVIYKNLTRLGRGYYNGKFAVEEAMFQHLKERGMVLKPGFIYGSRCVGNLEVSLGIAGVPLAIMTKPLYNLFGWHFFTPPIEVECVAKCALLGCIFGKNTCADMCEMLKGKLEYHKMHALGQKFHHEVWNR